MSTGAKTSNPMQGYYDFQGKVAKIAKAAFGRLDYKLQPRVFLLFIPEAQETDQSPVLVMPADECGYKPEFFSGVMKLARQIEEEEEARKPGRREPVKVEELKISAKSIQQAVEQTLNKSEGGVGLKSYCSPPVTYEGYKVCCVLQLDAEAFSLHFSLTVKWMLSTRLAGSLIDATAIEFVNFCAGYLRDPKTAGRFNDRFGREHQEILRLGGREFMFRATQDAGGASIGVFDAINDLSWKTHEGELAGGEIHLIHWDEYYLEMVVEFKYPPDFKDSGAARKVIEMAKAKRLVEREEEELYLVADGHSIRGIGRLKELEDEYDRYSEIFIVRFTGYYRWELIHRQGGLVMQVTNGVPSLPLDPIDRKKFKDHLQRRFIKSPANEEALWELIKIATKQKHGTMILISGDAVKEAERLEDQSTVLREPLTLSPETLLMLSSIDGALLVDPSGTCHAAGVILDGTAIRGKGLRSRGSRYNSAIGYINAADEKESECLIVVISEDGMINLMPDLRDRIRRSEIPARMERLRAAVAPEIVDVREYYKALNWLSAHRFYLSQELSDEINQIKNATKPRLDKQEGYSLTPADFKANDEMNDKYFLEEAEQ